MKKDSPLKGNAEREALLNLPAGFDSRCVRVTGYNAYFVGLGKEIQDEIIAREAHRL